MQCLYIHGTSPRSRPCCKALDSPALRLACDLKESGKGNRGGGPKLLKKRRMEGKISHRGVLRRPGDRAGPISEWPQTETTNIESLAV